MIFKLVLMRVGQPTEIVTADLDVLPSVHEYVMVSGQPYRVEDVTHMIETKEVEVRAVA